MRALVVGAGSVGQVFGHHLARGGAQVGFLVKEAHRDAAQHGYTLYPLNRSDPKAPVRLQPGADYAVRTQPSEVAREALAGEWDQIYLTVSSTGLRAGTWLAELAPASGRATVVSLLPGFHDAAYLAQYVPPSRTVAGMIGFASYRAPMPGEAGFETEGMAYWFPPLSPSAFSGPPALVAPVVLALRAGGLPARASKDVPASSIVPSAFFMGHIAALEIAGWSFEGLADLLPLAAAATREAMAIGATELNRAVPLASCLVWPWLVWAGLQLAPGLTPFDLETYLRQHFTKVGDQMRLALPLAIATGERAQLRVSALRELLSQLPAAG